MGTSDYLPRNSNQWISGPVVPGEEMEYGCVVRISPEEFAVIGGYDGSGASSTRTVKYNTKTMKWSEWGNLVQARWKHGCTLVDGNIIVAGGWGDGRYLRSTEVISVETGISRLVGDMHEARADFALVTVGEGQSKE